MKDTGEPTRIYIDLYKETELEEFTPLGSQGERRVSETIELTTEVASNLSRRIGALCNNLYKDAHKELMDNPPSKFNIEFGVQITGKTSIKII